MSGIDKVILRDFQESAIVQLENNENEYGIGSVLAFQMGLGKTITMASFLIKKRLMEHPSSPDLIIVPLCVMSQWKVEIKRLDSSMNVLIYHGPKRVCELNESGYIDFVISTYHSLITRELEDRKWNRVVLDEAHIIRNGIESKMKSLPKKVIGAFAMRSISRFCHCITGTPYNNNKNDIKSLMKFVGSEEDDVNDFVDNFVIQKTKEDIMEPINIETVMIEKSKDELAQYRLILRKYHTVLSMMKNANLEESRVLYRQAMQLMCTLRLYCDIMQAKSSKHVTIEMTEEEEVYEEIEFTRTDKLEFYESSVKIKTVCDKILDSIDDVPYRKILVFSSFVTSLDILECVLHSLRDEIVTFQYTGKKTRQERDSIVTTFTDVNDTRPMVLFATLGAGSCGLNLTPCATVYLVDVSMNPFDEFQALNRVHRLTQKNKVNVVKFCMKGMIEEDVLKSHARKIADAKSSGLLV